MVIGEALSDGQVREFGQIYRLDVLPDLQRQPGFEAARFMVEEGGNMAISLTEWHSREACLLYHSSRSYRNFVNRTQHLLVGNFVVKIFREE
jgi:heme-degrading monooxygenase HmoA